MLGIDEKKLEQRAKERVLNITCKINNKSTRANTKRT